MIKHLLSSLLLAVVAVAPLDAEIVVNPGELSTQIDDPASVTELSLAGRLNAADFKYIVTQMPDLAVLDMSAVEGIDACDDVFLGNISSHKAGVIPNGVFAGLPLTSVALPSFVGLEIGHSAFAATDIATIVIPASVRVVGDAAFIGCPKLTDVVCNAAELGVGVFADCPALSVATFGSSVDIPERCFYNDVALTTVNGDVTSVGDRAFAGCSSLEQFDFGASLAAIGKEAFRGAGLETVDLTPCKALASVGDWAFAEMPRVTSVNTGSVATLGTAIAFKCPHLVRFTTSEATSEIPDFALSKSSAIGENSLLHDGIEHIGNYAFSGLTGIELIQLPSNLASLGDHAMENMTGLTEITASMSYVPEVGEDVWSGVDQSQVKLFVAPDMSDAFKNAGQWQNFEIIGDTSGITDSESESNVINNLRARFDGDDLIVQTNGIDIERLSLYNAAGVMLIAVEPTEPTIIIDTEGFATRIYILHAVLADGHTAALKIAKR